MKYTIDNPLRCFFAFEGYNSQGLALNRLKQYYPDFGWVCVGRSEIYKYSIQAANVLFPEYADRNYGDISKIDWIEVPDFDLFTYSFPCTNLSFAGKQEGFDEGSGTASSLLWVCRNAIVTKKPKYLVMENVKALLSAKFKPLFMKWQNELASYGYVNFVKVLDSQHFGVPQHRERVFMVSILDENASYHFPEPFPLEKKLKDVLESNVDEKYYLSEKYINGFLAHAERHKNDGFKFPPTDGNVIANTILASSQCRPCDNFIKVIGNMYDCGKQAGRIYDSEGISPTLDNMASGGNKSPKIVEPNFGNQRLNELLKMQNIPLDEPICIDTYNQSVVKDVFCTIKSNIDRENLKYVTEPLSCAMRGRNLNDPSDRTRDCVTGQRLEIGDDKANTITTVQKDSMVVEPKLLGYTRDDSGRVVNRTLKNVANTIHTSTGHGGNTDCLVYEPQVLGVTVNPGRKREFENGYIRGDISHTLTAQDAKNTSIVWEQGFRIRKLTPRETFRLMDVDDKDIDKLLNSGISNTQLYKMAGNSITIAPLYHIFRKLFIEKENENQQLTLF